MSSVCFRAIAACVVALIGASVRVAAQSDHAGPSLSRFDVALAATLNGPGDVNQKPDCTNLDLPCTSPRTFPDFGVSLQVGWHLAPHLSLVAEGSTYVNEWDTVGVNTRAVKRENHVSAVLAGARLVTGTRHIGAGTDDEAFQAFVQLLAGPEASTVLPTRLAVQPGAGVDFKLSAPQFWFRVSADYRWTNGGPRNLSGSRILAGLVFLPSPDSADRR